MMPKSCCFIELDNCYELVLKSRIYGIKSSFFDKEHFHLVKNIGWNMKKQNNRFYCSGNILKDGKRKSVTFHRLIMGFPNKEIDHKDNNGLNNRNCNLRLSTHSQNNMNKGIQKSNSTGFKGVHFNKSKNKFEVYVWVNNIKIHGGYYSEVTEAALRYNELAKINHQEFASLNNI